MKKDFVLGKIEMVCNERDSEVDDYLFSVVL